MVGWPRKEGLRGGMEFCRLGSLGVWKLAWVVEDSAGKETRLKGDRPNPASEPACAQRGAGREETASDMNVVARRVKNHPTKHLWPRAPPSPGSDPQALGTHHWMT